MEETAADERALQVLKARAFFILGQGIMPFVQWRTVFQDAALAGHIRSKAFSVWFPTMLEYLRQNETAKGLFSELTRRNVDASQLERMMRTLSGCYASVLRGFTRDEQLFLNDRRLQNVHGHLSMFFLQVHRVAWYSGETERIERAELSAPQYAETMYRFYPNMQEAETRLLNRLIESPAYQDLGDSYERHLHIERDVARIGRAMGVLSVANV